MAIRHIDFAIANWTPSADSEISPEKLMFTYIPRHITDLLHDISTLPESDIWRLLEDQAAVMEEMRAAKCDAQQVATERMMTRQPGQFWDLPTDWGTPSKPWLVWLH